jgi:coenzyme F420-reducing hydrogenase alpha subunit
MNGWCRCAVENHAMPRTIKVNYLARVEGEGALVIRYSGRRPKSVELRIFEPPRFFEAMLRGRELREAPDITARICGICPVAYQMSACHAVEDALGVTVSPEVRALRRLLYTGEWIESHALHVFLLHAPDFLGYPDAVAMAKDHRELVESGLRIKKAGNATVIAVGGREIHPINVRVGGFYRAPDRSTLAALRPELDASLELMGRCLERFSHLEFPEFERDYEFVALRHPEEYPMCEGRIVSNAGLDIAVRDYDAAFVEEQVPRSTALHSRLRERDAYVCGPLARINLNFDRLGPRARLAAERAGFCVPCKNPFKALLARCIEVIQALDDACAIIDAYVAPEPPAVELPALEGIGYGCTEAPRGILYHRYRLDAQGLIEDAKIVPPTSQNQRSIEADLFELASQIVDLPHDQATLRAEQAVRNYDPCISCSTHFLKLRREHDVEDGQ